jgi:CheY-like chemotaxis protein
MGLVESRRPVVLIVEDDYLLRLDAAGMIEATGFDVVGAANADEAITILESRNDITVVFSDVQMPGSMDGLEACARGARALAADQDRHHFRPANHRGNRSAGRRAVFAKALQPHTGQRPAA